MYIVLYLYNMKHLNKNCFKWKMEINNKYYSAILLIITIDILVISMIITDIIMLIHTLS